MIPFAFFIFFLGGAHRVGDSVHCAKCDYEQTRGETGERCPECANLWLEPGGVVHGHVIRRPALKWAGAAVFVAVFALMLFPMFFRGRTNALKPTWLLIDEVVGTWGFTMDQWAELGGRTLTRDHELELMRGLLDKRIERGWLSGDANRWLGAMLQAGKVSADLTERYYREMLRAEFAEAGPAVVDQPITLTIDIAGSRPLWVKQELLMVVDGTYVDDASTPMGRATTPLDIWDLPEAGFRRYRFATAEIVPRQPGPMRVRFVFWHLYATPQNAAPPIVWSADNRPVLPPTVIWSRKVELETVVEVSAR